MTDDPRIDKLPNAAILTDTQLKLTFAPANPDARVVALAIPIRKTRIDNLALLMQQGKVHLQLKAGFAPERHLVFEPAEIALLHDMLDRFMQELPTVDKKAAE